MTIINHENQILNPFFSFIMLHCLSVKALGIGGAVMLNFTVGPVMLEQDILEIGSEQIPYFRTNDFSELMLENEMLLKKCAGASKQSRVIFLTGSGTSAMEAAVINLLDNNDKVLIVNGGNFGNRFKEICNIHKLAIEEICLNYGEPLTNEHLEPYENKGFTSFLINVHETSTGVLYDMNLVKDFCQRNNLLLIADAISTFLADNYNMEEYGVNATIFSSQKAIALPPGMSFVILDEKAQKRVTSNHIPSLYFDFNRYLIDGKRGQTPYTPAVGILIQLRKRLERINKTGVDNIVLNVASIANDFRSKIKGLPLEITSCSLSNALTPLKPKGKMSAHEIFKFLERNYKIFVNPSGGSLREVLFRVGHIGAITEEDNTTLIKAFFDMNERGIL